ncbi:MAG: response regulator [Firmicutes bacterium]|nr:response regulator [Bacillota bacterium]
MARTKTVLVVDDSPLVRLRVKNALADLDVNVLEMRRAEDLLAAPGLVAGADVVILDLNLAGADGLTVLRHLREEHGLSRVPVMVITASAAPDDVRRAFELGAVDYLLKPFTDEALLARLERVLGPLTRPGPSSAELRLRLEGEVRREVKRGRRGNTPLSLVGVGLPPGLGPEEIEDLRARVAAVLRETDTCLPAPGGGLVLLLPVTPKEGAEVVRRKVQAVLERAGVATERFRIVGFPDDGNSEKALLAALEREEPADGPAA